MSAGPPSRTGTESGRPRLHVFFATDGSATARFAQAHILSMPWRAPVHVTVMTAVHIPRPPFVSFVASAQQAFDAALVTLRRDAATRAEELLSSARSAIEAGVASVATRMHFGTPGPMIVEMARACRVDLVAVGSRGLGPYKGYLLGSVSDHVANHARCSVLVAKTPPKRSGRYLLALDDSPYAVAVLRWLAELDLSRASRIHLVKVFRSARHFALPEAGTPEYAEEPAASAQFAPWSGAPDVLAALRDEGYEAAGDQVTAEVRVGHEAQEILAAVKRFDPDLLVIGAKGHYAPASSPLGGVTRKVIDHAPCSVLVVRPSAQPSPGIPS